MLIHGIGSYWRAWEPVIGPLAAEREVYAVDLPGFGESELLREGAPTVANLAAAVASFMAERGVDTFHVAGNSLGGGVAFELARSGHARSVCAISPIWFWKGAELVYTRGLLRFGRGLAKALVPYGERPVATAAQRTALMGVFFGKPARMSPREAAAAFANLAVSPGWDETLATAIRGELHDPAAVACPTTVLWGRRDALLPPWQRKRAAAALPHARVIELPGCGHVPFSDDPDLVAAEILLATGAQAATA